MFYTTLFLCLWSTGSGLIQPPHSAESGVISLSKFFINLMICWPSGQIFRTFYTYDAVHINQSWAVDNVVVILRPKPSKFFVFFSALKYHEPALKLRPWRHNSVLQEVKMTVLHCQGNLHYCSDKFRLSYVINMFTLCGWAMKLYLWW